MNKDLIIDEAHEGSLKKLENSFTFMEPASKRVKRNIEDADSEVGEEEEFNMEEIILKIDA